MLTSLLGIVYSYSAGRVTNFRFVGFTDEDATALVLTREEERKV